MAILWVMNLTMADVLRKIKQTEREAARKLSAAKDEASKIVLNARKKSTELVSKASDDSSINYKLHWTQQEMKHQSLLTKF